MLNVKTAFACLTLFFCLFHGVAAAADIAKAQKDARAVITAIYEAAKVDDTNMMDALMSPALSEKLRNDGALMQQWRQSWRQIAAMCEFKKLNKPREFPGDDEQFSITHEMHCCQDLKAQKDCKEQSGHFVVLKRDDKWYINE